MRSLDSFLGCALLPVRLAASKGAAFFALALRWYRVFKWLKTHIKAAAYLDLKIQLTHHEFPPTVTPIRRPVRQGAKKRN